MQAFSTLTNLLWDWAGQGATGISESDCGLLEGVFLEGKDLTETPVTVSPKECCNLCGVTPGELYASLSLCSQLSTYPDLN